MSAAWTDDRIEALRKLWQGGGTASEIGEAIGVSRNSVLAKARRLGLTRRERDQDYEELFERVVDLVADAALNKPISVRDAARRLRLPFHVVDPMWAAVCRKFGEHHFGGNSVVKVLP